MVVVRFRSFVALTGQIKAGVVMNIVCLVVLQLGINTWAHAYFDLGDFPDWARDHDQFVNATTTSALPVLRQS